MTPTQRAAMEQALEVLKHGLQFGSVKRAAAILEAALAEPAEQEEYHLIKLGWRAIQCPVCGESAQAFQPEHEPSSAPTASLENKYET